MYNIFCFIFVIIVIFVAFVCTITFGYFCLFVLYFWIIFFYSLSYTIPYLWTARQFKKVPQIILAFLQLPLLSLYILYTFEQTDSIRPSVETVSLLIMTYASSYTASGPIAATEHLLAAAAADRFDRRSTRSLYAKLAALWPLQLLPRLLTPQTCRTIAEVRGALRKRLSPRLITGASGERKENTNHAAAWGSDQLGLSNVASEPPFWRTPGYELWAFSLLMNRASNAGDRGDSLISVSRWQISIEFWKEISLYSLPWITEILAPMAPVYEGKMFRLCLILAGLRHSARCINGDGIELRLSTQGERCVDPLLFKHSDMHFAFIFFLQPSTWELCSCSLVSELVVIFFLGNNITGKLPQSDRAPRLSTAAEISLLRAAG